MIRKCVVCDGEFEARTSRVKACSPVCSHVLERETENKRKASKTQMRVCVVCEAIFRPKGPAKVCSHKCGKERNRRREAARDREAHRELCRDWRRRNPDKQKASTKHWEENNREKHLEATRRRTNEWRSRHPQAHAEESKRFRERHPEKAREYGSMRTSAFQLARLIEKYGLAALDADFVEPKLPDRVLKGREATRQWRRLNPEKRREYEQRLREENREALLDIARRSHARESAAVNLIRELQSKGLEALL